MKVALLCAGYATRLYPLTLDKPKALLPVAERPILEWIVEALRGVSTISSIYVITNHRFVTHFEVWAKTFKTSWPIEVIDDGTTTNENRLGAIGDLHFALKQKQVTGEDVLVIAGDNLFNFDLKQWISDCIARRPAPVIATYDVKDLELAKQYGLVQAGKDGKVIRFFEKPEHPVTTLASCGLYWLPKETSSLLDRYVKEGNNLDQPGHYMRWLSEQTRLDSLPLEGKWFDIGDLKSYETANQIFGQNLKTK